MKMKQQPRTLFLAAALSAAVALVHALAIFAGPAAYAYLGAPDLAAMEAGGSVVPDVVTAALVGVFGLFAVYPLAAAGWLRLPWTRPMLVAIGSLYALRGLAVFPEAFLLLRGTATFPRRYLAFSLASLLIGLCYLWGVRALRSAAAREPGRAAP